MLYNDHYTMIMDRLKQGEAIPMRLRDGVIHNTGAIYSKERDGSYALRALGTTTSSKFNAFTPEFIRLTGIRAILGKGGLDADSLAAMKECGCVYLALAGGCCAVYTPMAEVTADFWPEYKPIDNQRLKLSLKEFGPLFVAMDAHGGSIFAECAAARDKLPAMYTRLGIDSVKVCMELPRGICGNHNKKYQQRDTVACNMPFPQEKKAAMIAASSSREDAPTSASAPEQTKLPLLRRT